MTPLSILALIVVAVFSCAPGGARAQNPNLLCWQKGDEFHVNLAAQMSNMRLAKDENNVPVCIVIGNNLAQHASAAKPLYRDDIPVTSLPDELDAGRNRWATGQERTNIGHRIIFFPTVDEFSMLEVADSYGNPIIDPPVTNANTVNTPEDLFNINYYADMQVQVEAGGMASMPKRRLKLNPSTNKFDAVVPFWTVVIRLRDGKVTEIKWDDGCFTCGKNLCVDDFCAVPRESYCIKPGTADESTKECDVKIYVAWIGTDRNGEYLTSASKRMSRFESFGISDLTRSTLKRYS
jgi:hypothetical protein